MKGSASPKSTVAEFAGYWSDLIGSNSLADWTATTSDTEATVNREDGLGSVSFSDFQFDECGLLET
jgi:hypothetical protein